MPRDTAERQARFVTAVENTKHHYGLWRGQLVHPQFGVVTDEGEPAGVTMSEVIESGDPITDAKGLGIRLFWRAPKGVIPHFFIRDDHYAALMEAAGSRFHDAAVRVLANFIREEGYSGLRSLVACKAFPKTPFAFGGVYVERDICVNGVPYRPDITVEHAVAGYPRIELEVVNQHPPKSDRLRAARAEGALVLSMNIYDLVQHYILDGRSRDFVPPDDELLARLKNLRFADVKRGDSTEHHTFQAQWLDKEQVPYLRGLCVDVEVLAGRVKRAIETCARLSGKEVLNAVWNVPLEPQYLALERVEDWVVRSADLRFSSDDSVAMPFEIRTVDKVLKNWAGAAIVPPGVALALADLRRARKSLNSEINKLIDIAESCWVSAVKARQEELDGEVPIRRAGAARKFRVLLLGVEKDFRLLEVDMQKFIGANAGGAVRVHRRGPLAGNLARPNALQHALMLSRAEKLRQQLKDAYDFAYASPEGAPLRDLLRLPEDTVLPAMLRREVEALAEVLNSPALPTEQDISRLVKNINVNYEAR